MAKAVIIGGGVSGLSAGIAAAERGHEVTVIEKHTVPGGNLTGWDRGGYHIDNCIHWLTGTNPVTDLYGEWESLGAFGKEGVFLPDFLYTYEKDGRSVSLVRDAEALSARMKELSPADSRETDRFIAAVRAAKSLTGVSRSSNAERSGAWERAAAVPRLFPYYFMTAGELARRFSDPLLSGFLREFLTESFGALGLIFVFAAFCGDNGGIPRGSSRAMALRMADRFVSSGGELRTGAEAKKIDLDGRRAVSVTLADGERITCDFVIPACDPDAVFGKLIDGRFMPAALKRRYNDASLFRFSSCHAAFSLDGPPPFRGDLIVDVAAPLPEGLRARTAILREFSHEPSFSPPGKSVIEATVFCDEDESRRFIAERKNGERYGEVKRAVGDALLSVVLTRFPGLRGRVETLDVWTPATYSEYTNAGAGSYMSFAFSSRRVPRFMKGKVRGLDNVILATQWQRAPGGLPNAACAGIAAARTLDRLAGVTEVTRTRPKRRLYGIFSFLVLALR
ncbi:MAG: NAD(P)/FAD-dependent oxidoreductase [Clostridia bacterium]|nr:NAD(P)/FAD-dependent oxidoreductase [Clostridia bacterium]